MSKQWLARGAGALLTLGGMAIACGGKPAPNTAQNTAKTGPAAAEVHERIVPHTCAARTKLAQLFGHTTPPSRPASEQSAESAPPPPTSTVGTAKIPANQAYRIVAPATVLIRTGNSMGTGVVIDPKGYVLTNYHVVADGRKQDFVVTVNVTFGDLTPTGRMSRQEKTYEAVVVKTDMIRDLAILKVKDPPAKLEAVKLAKSAPQIAEKVISIGHAGIGFLWAAKTCSVASVGERQQDLSRLAAFDCTDADPALSATEATRYKTGCDEVKKQMSDALAASTQGLAIQTDCAITHGDSGGPLVNAAGEMVGLNQSIAVDVATAGFHVHLDELREFVAKYPAEGVAIVPDPLCDGGSNPTLEDVDLDGIPETLVTKGTASALGGYDRMSLLIDLDENHFSKAKAAKKDPSVGDPYEAEIALLTIADTTYVWFDTDDDGRFDLLLVDKDNDGKPENAYRLDAEGRPKEDKDALPKHDFSSKLVKDATLHARLGKIANAIGDRKYLSRKMAEAASTSTAIPDPVLGVGTTGRVIDSDGNGKGDLAVARGAFSRGILVDADEDTLASLKTGDSADELLKAKKIDAEVSIIIDGNAVWAIYDTDNDSKFDLALMTNNAMDATSLSATSAWHVAGGKEMTPAPEFLGRKILRPGLMPTFPRVATALNVVFTDVATDEGMGSLPDPRLSPKAVFHPRDLGKGFPAGTIIEAQTSSSSSMIIDVDHDPKSDAEVAILHHSGPDGGSDWIYYDTDNDGKFDLVLYAAASGQEPTQAYRLVKGSDKLVVDSAAVAGRPFRTKSVFKDHAMASKWKAIAGTTFTASSIEQ